MAFKNEDLFNMENIVKATGLSEDKLADLIIAKEEEGWTNEEIAQLLYENMDNEQYKSKAQDELDALYSLGFNPGPGYNPQGGKRGYTEYVEPEDPEWLDWTTHTKYPGNSTPKDNGLTDLKKIGDSWMNYRDNTDPMYRVGLVNAIFGDPSMLGQYYQMQNANEQNRLNREAQKEYNNYWKELERQDKLKAEVNEKNKRLQAAKVEYAKMLKELQTAGPADQVIINAQINQLLKEYPDIDRAVEVDGNMVNPMLSTASKAAEDEREYQKKLAVFTSKLPTSFKTDTEKTKKIAEVMGDDSLRDTDKQAIAKELRAIKSQEQITAEAKAAAVASAVTKPIGDRASALNEYNTLMAKKFKTTDEENKIAALKKQWGF